MKKKQNNYAFIDSQNLNLGIRSQGWAMDWKKFRLYLRNKYQISKAYLFIGLIKGNEPLYASLQEAGFLLIFKPTLERKEAGKSIVKGNVDAELVLHAMIHFEAYHQAVIVSGDGDFFCLIDYLEEQGKLAKLLTPTKHFSSLLRKFDKKKYIVRLDLLKSALELNKKDWHSRSVETLG